MPPVQRTFQLVPEVAKPMSRPPMTSKAAKKAYMKANQGPKVSRAEQRRLDREAVEKTNKEYEKEKAAAKARAVREKKAAKALAEKEERRRKGIPEPSRFVRASQPTISRFIRPGSKRTREDMENLDEDEEAEDTPAEDEAFETILEESNMEKSEEPKDGDAPVGKFVSSSANMEPPAKKVAMTMEIESEDEFGDFPSLSQTDILQKVDSPSVSFNQDEAVPHLVQKEPTESGSDDFPTLSQCEILEKGNLPPGAITISRSCTLNAGRPSRSPSPGKVTQEKSKLITNSNLCGEVSFAESQLLVDMAQTQIPPKLSENEARSDGVKSVENMQQPAISLDSTPQSINVNAPLNTVSDQKPYTSHAITYPPKQSSTPRTANMPPPKFLPPRHPLHDRSVNSMPPPALPKQNQAKSVSSLGPTSRFSSRNTSVRGYRSPAPNLPPTPTQAFLENNLDDFFPSPSQEIRELLDDMDDLPSNTQIAQELSPVKQISKESNDSFKVLISTPDFATSSGDMCQLNTPSRPPNQMFNLRRDSALPGKYSKDLNQPHPYPRSPLMKENTMKPPPVPSKRMEWTRPKPFIATAKPVTTFQIPHTETTTRTPLRTSALARSQNANTTTPTPVIRLPPTNEKIKSSSPKPPPIPPKTPLSPPPKRRFFEEKEEDLLHGALWESRLEARALEKARQQAEAQTSARKKAQARQGEGLLQRAVREAEARQEQQQAAQNKAAKESPSQNKRTLQRAGSATDYGDDEFSGCSQELLALCC
ncbi:hypothetical protein HYALB_00001880 [Hymenoscyphus albidus]|uniref:Uncharacterized protein n=1 Tax=Hymenoscyphus albidus TaxID=595503 RepID=A0A9N9LFR3_9HELO|nr:hypothetical protein HYALB_00001880 [Hymenoscyphus albidus]